MAHTTDLQRFRFYADGTEAGASALAAQNTNIQVDVSAANGVAVLRAGLQETGAEAQNGAWLIEYSHNGGAWTQLTTSTPYVRGYNSSSLTDDGATTSRLTGGTGTFDAGAISEDGTSASTSLGASRHTEALFPMEIVKADVNDGDRIDFRVKHGAATAVFTVVPRITVVKGPNERFFGMFFNGAVR